MLNPGTKKTTATIAIITFSMLGLALPNAYPMANRVLLDSYRYVSMVGTIGLLYQDHEAVPDVKLAQKRGAVLNRTRWTNPETIKGHQDCVGCHEQETRSWLDSKHASHAFDLLIKTEKASRYARKLGMRPAEITNQSLCLNCHATKNIEFDSTLGVIQGVSCEACHNGAGGQHGWLNIHAVYGPNGTRRTSESKSHYSLRKARNHAAGQLGPSSLYGLTKRCFDCHVTGDELLIDAGHNQGEGFEFVQKSQGEVRHNFFLNPNRNAAVSSIWTGDLHGGLQRSGIQRLRVMFILGQMVDLEISLRNLARATEENQMSDTMLDRIDNAYTLLADDVIGAIDNASDKSAYSSIAAVVEVVEPVWEQLCDDGVDCDKSQEYVALADSIAKIAIRFSHRDGSQLDELDDLGLIPN